MGRMTSLIQDNDISKTLKPAFNKHNDPDSAIKRVQKEKGEIKFMFRVGHPYKVKFDLIIIGLSCYNAFSIPL